MCIYFKTNLRRGFLIILIIYGISSSQIFSQEEKDIQSFHIGCSGISRSDFRYDDIRNNLYMLEINTQPGMTKLSLVPEIALNEGISFLKLIEWMLKDASKEK